MNTISPQLRWACRRGMLELDILLGNFLSEAYLTLSKDDQILFERLINEANDQDLFVWLTGKTAVTNAEFVNIIEMIRYHAKNRHSS